jgi:hypothetical protein
MNVPNGTDPTRSTRSILLGMAAVVLVLISALAQLGFLVGI